MTKSFEECEQWLSGLQALCSNRVGHARTRVTTQDLQQEVALQMVGQHPDNWQKTGGTYLQRVVCGHAAKARRFHSQERRSTALERPIAAEDTASFLTPVEILEKREAQARLAAALQQLDEDLQQVVILRFFKKLTQIEVGERLQFSERKVRLKLAVAMRELKRRLREDYDYDDR